MNALRLHIALTEAQIDQVCLALLRSKATESDYGNADSAQSLEELERVFVDARNHAKAVAENAAMNGAKVLKKDHLVAHLRDIASTIEADDSFEGGISYSCLVMPGDVPGLELQRDEFLVKGMYRVGNSMGQGGSVLIRGPHAFPLD